LTRLIIAGAACVGLIALLTLLTSRLIRARRSGLSIRMQVFLALAGIVGAFAFGLGLLVIDRIEARAARLAQAAAHNEAHAIAALLQSEIKRTGVPFSELAKRLHESSPTTAHLKPRSHTSEGSEMTSLGIELIDPQGKVLFPSGRLSRAHEVGAVYVDQTVERDGEVLGVVRVVKGTIVIQAMLADFAPTVLVISLVLGSAAAAAAAFIGQTIAAPIEELSIYSKRVSAGERPQLPDRVTGRELKRLVNSIETMRERLEGRPFVETFAADLSHELKNPVAAIRASAEVLTEGALEEPEQAARFVARIHEAAARIERLLAELLSLASVETRGPEHLDAVPLAPLVDSILSAHGDEGRRVKLHIDAHAAAHADKVWLTRALSNLIDNALFHSPAGSTVDVRIEKRGEETFVTVENEGTLDEHVKKSLFRRFVTTRRDQGGTGLGLSIVRAVAEAHGGHVEFIDDEPGRITFQMRLPAAKFPT
jgi:two-component system, OmpR family, sensor histidine kinase CreC